MATSANTQPKRLAASEMGSYNDFRTRMVLRILNNGGSQQDALNYLEHLEGVPGVQSAIETPVTVSNQEQGISDVPSLLGVPAQFVQGVTVQLRG